MGDVIRISDDIYNYEEFRVLDVFSDMFNTHIKLGGSCKKLFPGTSKISFYTDSNVDQKRCVFGTIEEGIYLEFVPNELKKKKTCHEEINFKNITEIRLNVAGSIYKKEFSLKG